MKILLWMIVIIVVYWLVRNKLRASGRLSRAPTEKPAGEMRRCDYCGVYFPAEEGVSVKDRFFCGSAHSQAAEEKAR